MSSETDARFLARALSLFGSIPEPVPRAAPSDQPAIPGPEPDARDPHARELVLVAGMIADPRQPERLTRLLDDLLALSRSPEITSLDVVVLENGPEPSVALDAVAASLRTRGLSIFLAGREQQEADAEADVFGAGFARPFGRASISDARRMLHRYAAMLAHRREGAIAWILDDDVRLDNLRHDGTHASVAALASRMAQLPRFRSRGVDVVIGTVTSAPPVPFSSCVRVQMVDLVASLRAMVQRPPGSPWVSEHETGFAQIRLTRDYYYDLSRSSTSHLERHVLYRTPAASTLDALMEMATRVGRILAGEQVFRPLVDSEADLLASAWPSEQRGGNTFILTADAIDGFLNTAPSFEGQPFRRSDMIWAAESRYAGGRRVWAATIAVRQDRSSDPPSGLDLDRLVPDIRGFALYSALRDVLDRRRRDRLRDGLGAEAPDDLRFKGEDIDLMLQRFKKYLEERTSAFALSFHRIRGLAREGTFVLKSLSDAWAGSVEAAPAFAGLRAFFSEILGLYRPEALEEVIARMKWVDPDMIRTFVHGLATHVEDLGARASSRRSPGAQRWLESQRELNGRAIASKLAPDTSLRCLGLGSEGVVFTDETWVYKVFDYPKIGYDHARWDAFRGLVGKASVGVAYYALAHLDMVETHLVLRYAFEPSHPYEGGHAAALVQMLRDARRNGFVFTNLAPKNLRVANGVLRLIDYGADVRAFDLGLFDDMVRRAWLTLRAWDRADLPELMRRATAWDRVPELSGCEWMRFAVEIPTKTELTDARLAALVADLAPANVLDYGCGRGELADLVARCGIAVTGYDPDPGLASRWRNPEVTWQTTLDSLGERQFEVVVTSLVLCVLDDPAYETTLRELARRVHDGGRLVLALCHPDHTVDGTTAFQTWELPEGADHSATFVCHKTLSSGRRRADVHRPKSRIVADLKKLGFSIEHEEGSPGVSLATLAPISDVWICVARRGTRARASVMGEARVPARVFAYHRVLPKCEGERLGIEAFHEHRGMIVDAERFARQMRQIRERYEPVAAREFVDALCGRRELPVNACLVTFDDGYADFEEVALPILEAAQIPSVLFPVQASARGAWTPVDELYAILANDAAGCLTPEERDDLAFGKAKRKFIHARPEHQQERLDALARRLGQARLPMPSGLYLTEARLRAMPKSVTLGSHGTQHHLLTTLTDAEVVASLAEARQWLEGLRRARFDGAIFAFPSGDHDPRVAFRARQVGHLAAFTVQSSDTFRDLFMIPRTCVTNDDLGGSA